MVRAPVTIVNCASNPCKQLCSGFYKEDPHKKRKINYCNAFGPKFRMFFIFLSVSGDGNREEKSKAKREGN